MKKKATPYVLLALGLLLFGGGLVLMKTQGDPQGIMRALPYVCVGIGCGLIGQGGGELIARRAFGKNPELQRQKEIELKDERNVMVSNRAKARAFDLVIPVFGALQLAFALMGVDMAAVLLLAFAYLFVVCSSVYYGAKYNKEM